MAAARLQRLRHSLQLNLDALPDRAPTEPPVSDSDVSDRVPLHLLDAPSKQPPPDHTPIPEPNTPATISPPNPPAPLPSTTLTRGDLGSATQHYSPIVALSKYPYKWCNKTHSQHIASAFFDQGKFWAREWDLYYLWDIDHHDKPLILICESQLHRFLGEINTHLKLDLCITLQQREDALVSRFPDHPRCTPRYLGRSQSRQHYDAMLENVPAHNFRSTRQADGSPPLDDLSLDAFKQLMEDSFEAQKTKNKAAKAKKQQERLVKQKSLTDQFKRAQRYLGLRPTPLPATPTQSAPAPSIDPALPTPFDFDQSVVFVCVDVESYERAHHKITEVGIATLDTRELVNVAPGTDGDKWRALIRTRHFRIKEYAHLVNHEFVQGCPDRFYFGESTFVPLADAPAHVAACFAPPFGAHRTNGVDGIIGLIKGVDLNEKRNLVFLGHDTLGDVKYLQNLGFDPMKVDNLLEALDTAILYRVWRRELNATGLGRILHGFDIAGHGLHNAGNDAAYTVQAMLAICVREASLRGSPELDNMRSSEHASRLAAAVEEAQEKATNEAEGWSDHETDGHGGPPVPLAIAPSKLTPAPTTSTVPPGSKDRGGFRGRGRGRGGPQAALYNPHEPGRGSPEIPHIFPLGGLHGWIPGGPYSYMPTGHVESTSRGRGRGRDRASLNTTSDNSTPGGLHGYTPAGHVESTSRGRGRGRGRASRNPTSDSSKPGSQVRLLDLS